MKGNKVNRYRRQSTTISKSITWNIFKILSHTCVFSYKISFSSSASMLKVRSGISLTSFCKSEMM